MVVPNTIVKPIILNSDIQIQHCKFRSVNNMIFFIITRTATRSNYGKKALILRCSTLIYIIDIKGITVISNLQLSINFLSTQVYQCYVNMVHLRFSRGNISKASFNKKTPYSDPNIVQEVLNYMESK